MAGLRIQTPSALLDIAKSFSKAVESTIYGHSPLSKFSWTLGKYLYHFFQSRQLVFPARQKATHVVLVPPDLPHDTHRKVGYKWVHAWQSLQVHLAASLPQGREDSSLRGKN